MGAIGVWNTAFLGDAILTLPLIQTLHAAYPDAAIDFWVRKGVGSLFASHPAISAVHEYDKRGKDKGLLRSFALGHSLSGRKYSLWISAHASLRSALMARWSSAKIRIGYDAPAFNAWFYTRTVPRRFSELDEIERLQQLLLPLNLAERGITPCVWPDIVLPEDARAKAAAFFASLSNGGGVPILGVHPGSVWATKRWLPEYFAAITARAVKEGAKVLVFGGPGEEGVADEVVRRAVSELTEGESAAVTNLAGTLPLVDLAAYLGNLNCYVTNDSGPMHLAWPQKTPVTAVFGPTVRELGFFPRGDGATVLECSLPCRPCGLHGHKACPEGHHNCMVKITPDMVWADVAGKLFRQAQATAAL